MARPKPAPGRSPEAELAGLITTRDNLQARQTALATEVEQAVAARRELLIGGADAAAISGAERTCRELEGTAFGVADALAEIERRVQAVELRIEESRAAGEREDAAALLERDGKAIDTAADRVRRAVEDLAKAGDTLAAAITPTSAPLFAKHDRHGARDRESPERITAELVGHLLAAIMPVLDIGQAADVDPARTFLTDPMRSLASSIRAGEASPRLGRYVRPEPNFETKFDNVEVFVLEAFTYLSRTGYVPEIVRVRHQRLPAPVAELAIEQGLASETEPSGWELLRERERARANRGTNVNDLPPLGFNLEEWRAAETKRRRDSWLAEQREAA